MNMDAGNWAEIFRAGRKNLPADHASPIVALGRALLAMEEKALEIGARHGEAPPTYRPLAPVTEPEPSSIPVRQWEVRTPDGTVWERWSAVPSDVRSMWEGQKEAYQLRGRLFFRDNDRVGGGWNEWIQCPSPSPLRPPDEMPS